MTDVAVNSCERNKWMNEYETKRQMFHVESSIVLICPFVKSERYNSRQGPVRILLPPTQSYLRKIFLKRKCWLCHYCNNFDWSWRASKKTLLCKCSPACLLVREWDDSDQLVKKKWQRKKRQKFYKQNLTPFVLSMKSKVKYI